MFAEGMSWRKKLVGMIGMYLVFLGLGLIYASRIFDERGLLYDGLLITLSIFVLLVAWSQYKKKTDPEFAVRVAERKVNPSPESKVVGKSGPLYLMLFHIVFLVLVLAFKYGLDRLAVIALTREQEIIFATIAATTVASLTVMSLVSFNDRRRAGRREAER